MPRPVRVSSDLHRAFDRGRSLAEKTDPSIVGRVPHFVDVAVDAYVEAVCQIPEGLHPEDRWQSLVEEGKKAVEGAARLWKASQRMMSQGRAAVAA